MVALLVVGLGLSGGLGLRRLLATGPEPAWGTRLTATLTAVHMSATGPVADLDVDLLTSDPSAQILTARACGPGIATPDRPVATARWVLARHLARCGLTRAAPIAPSRYRVARR